MSTLMYIDCDLEMMEAIARTLWWTLVIPFHHSKSVP